jgi:outer membrane protein
LAALENVDVQRDAVERSREQLNLIESMYEVGSAAKSDVLKQRVQLGNDRLTLISAENSVQTTRADLAYTIGLDPNADVEFHTEHISREFTGTLDEAIAFGMERRPDLLAAHKSLDAARHGVRSAWSTYLPTLGGSGSLTWFNGSSGDTVLYDNSHRTLTYSLTVSWNIFDGFWRERQLAQAKITRNNSRAQLSDQRNNVIVGIKTAYLDIEQTKLQQEVAAENVAAADEDLRITQEKYNLGAATILDLLNAQVSLKEAQVSLIRAEFDHNLAIARLENAMGKM